MNTRLLSLLLFPALLAAAPTPADLDTLRTRYVGSISPPPGPDADELVASAHKLVATMAPDHTWSDIDFTDQERNNWRVRPHLDRALLLAKAASVARRDNHPDPALGSASVAALDYWLARDLKNPNWWWNEIGVPQLTGETALLLGDACPQKTRDGVVSLMKRSVWTKWTGQNLVWGVTNQITRGLLTSDPTLISQAYSRLYDEITLTTKDGIQPDYSFHQHGDQLYSGGYGLGFANDVGRYIAFAHATPWQCPPEKFDIYSHYMLDGQAWMTWGPLFDYSALGREITRKGKSASPREWALGPIVPAGRAYSLLQTTTLLSKLPIPRQKEFESFSNRLQSRGANDLIGSRHFFRSDYTTHRRPTWFFTLKMFSTRLFNTELVNDEGKRSHHLGDGNTFLYQSGEEYRDIFPAWNWSRLPGTTAEQSDDLDKLLPKGNHARGTTDFVGGASDGTYGVSAMVLHRGKLSAKKSWFLLDDLIVCLGTDISCESDNPVLTTIEQSFSTHDATHAPENTWFHQNHTGYVIPDHQPVHLTDGPQSGSWADLGGGPPEKITRDIFSLTLNHGTHPGSAAYTYLILPGATADQTAAASKSLPVEILARTRDAHAVRHKSLDLTAAVFFSPGTVAHITVDHPCILLLRHNRLTVSDPTQKLASITVTLDNTQHEIPLPQGPLAGSSVTLPVR